jgi:hypothetical protein
MHVDWRVSFGSSGADEADLDSVGRADPDLRRDIVRRHDRFLTSAFLD